MLKEIGLNIRDGLQIYKPNYRFFLEEMSRGISFAKLNHSYWEMLNGKENWVESYEKSHDPLFMDQIKFILRNIGSTGIKLGVSGRGTPSSGIKKVTYVEIKKNLPNNYIPFDANCWKEFARNGKLRLLLKSLKKRKVIIVGLTHLHEVAKSVGLQNCEHFVITLHASSINRRVNILNRLKKIVTDNLKSKDKPVFIFQTGECFSLWLIYHLHMMNAEGFSFIDMGRSLDWFCRDKKMIPIDKKKYIFGQQVFLNQPWMNTRNILI